LALYKYLIDIDIDIDSTNMQRSCILSLEFTCTAQWHSDRGSRGCGPHRAALARGGKGAKNAEI